MRTLKYITVAYFVAAFLFTLYAMANFPMEKLVNLIFDDAYYYLGVAQNIAEGNGSTFGNLVETNGYQPLWLVILASIIYAFSLPKEWAFIAVPLLVILIKIVALLRLDTDKNADAVGVFFATVLIILLCPNIFSHGLETSLLLLVLPLLSRLKDYPEHFAPRICMAYAAIFTVLFLVRLDALAIAGVFGLFILAGRRKYAFTNLVLTGAITAFGVLIYFAVNYKLFGTIVPVSGQAKAIGNKVGENLPLMLQYLIASRLAIGAFVLSLIIRMALKKESRGPMPFSRELMLMTLSSIVIASYYALFSGWPMWGWYYWPIALVTYFAIAQLISLAVQLYRQSAQDWKQKLLAAGAWGFVAYVALLGVRTEMAHETNVFYSTLKKEERPNFTVMNLKLVNEFFAKAPDGVVAMGDRAGGLGFWLPERFKFFHTEGLVANKEFIAARRAGTGLEFLKQMNVKYFIVEREHLWEGKLADGREVHGIVEPVQGLSAHSGLMLICLPTDSILYTQSYDKQIRHVYDFEQVTACPDAFREKVASLSASYGELRKFSLPYEYAENNKGDWTLMKFIKSNPF